MRPIRLWDGKKLPGTNLLKRVGNRLFEQLAPNGTGSGLCPVWLWLLEQHGSNLMIKDLRIHGEVGGDKEFFATLSGEGLDGRYYHELVEREGVPHHRFFLGGSEFLLGPEALIHTGNGGSFCPYMFGVDEPIEDLVKPDVINRLVVFGVRHDDPGKIIFSDETTAKVDYRHVFLRGHAVFNYYFFIQFASKTSLKKQQEEILRVLGRSLKRFPLTWMRTTPGSSTNLNPTGRS